MKISELWLREWVNTSLDSESLFNQITMAGLEVDDVKPVAEVFNGVIIGEIIEYRKYEKSDKLFVTKVNIGKKRLLNVICKAQNCRQGVKVAVVTIDAILTKNLKAKLTTLHEESSDSIDGLLCSFFDLGISNESNSDIIELPINAPIGKDIREYLKLDDHIIEINVTPNRTDCFSIIGIARDISVCNNQANLNDLDIPKIKITTNERISIQVNEPKACPRYLSRIIKGINIRALTPFWMKEKLRRCGIHSINVMTDITNYVLLELGQPIHLFDKDKIEGGIIVRMAKKEDTMVLLSKNKKVRLNSNTLVITDHKKVLALGGVFGSECFGIHNQTENVIIESAFFNPLTVMRNSRDYGLRTDASHRYEHGVDPLLQYKAINYTTYLLVNICGGEPGPITDVTSEDDLPKRNTITLRRSKLDLLIGYHISDVKVSDILRRSGCHVDEYHDMWKVTAPSWRFDIVIEEDLIEEVLRIYGYNNIPNKPVQSNLKIKVCPESKLSLDRVKNMLNDKGYQEVITYSFVDPKLQKLVHPNDEALVLMNPISKEMSVMRVSLWTGLLKTIIYNQNRQQNRVRIFETGFRFIPDKKADYGVRQDFMLSGAISGNLYERHWDLSKKSVDFYDMKGDLESIFDLTGKLSEIKFNAKSIPALHPGKSATIYLQEKCIGFIGVIHPKLENKFGLNGPIIMFELEWSKISERTLPRAQKISCFPTNYRDIAIVVDKDVPAADILLECKKADIDHIVEVNLFDVYQGDGIKKGFKSLAISLVFQDSNHLLGEEEIADIINKYIKMLKEKFQASLRN